MFRFSIFGFPVQVQWFFWLTCVVLGGGLYAQGPEDWVAVAIWTAVVFVSIMVHELGHAFAGRRFGAHPLIVLHGLGGVTLLPNLRVTRPQSIALSLAGPAAGFALGALVLVLAPLLPMDGRFAQTALRYLLFVNLFWSAFNLLPILPMDGGQVLRDLLGSKNLRVTLWVGAAGAAILCALALMARQWFLAAFMGYLAYSNWKDRPVQGGVARVP